MYADWLKVICHLAGDERSITARCWIRRYTAELSPALSLNSSQLFQLPNHTAIMALCMLGEKAHRWLCWTPPSRRQRWCGVTPPHCWACGQRTAAPLLRPHWPLRASPQRCPVMQQTTLSIIRLSMDRLGRLNQFSLGSSVWQTREFNWG